MTAVTGGAALLGESEMADTPPVSWEQEPEESEGRHLQPRATPPAQRAHVSGNKPLTTGEGAQMGVEGAS